MASSVSSSSKSRFKVLLSTADGSKYVITVNQVDPDKNYVTIKDVKSAIADNPDMKKLGLADESTIYEVCYLYLLIVLLTDDYS